MTASVKMVIGLVSREKISEMFSSISEDFSYSCLELKVYFLLLEECSYLEA